MQKGIHHSSGFTLIEAIVALVLVGTAGVALFAWINSSLMSLNRVKEIHQQVECSRNVIEFMGTVNPALRPEGAVTLGVDRVIWHAVPSVGMTDGAGYPTGNSAFRLAMYKTDVRVERGEGRAFELTLRQVGYRKVR